MKKTVRGGVDHLDLLPRPTRHLIGPHQHVVDLGGEGEADHEADADADQRIDQALAQLDQVVHQRRLGRLDLVLPLLGRVRHVLHGPRCRLHAGAAGLGGCRRGLRLGGGNLGRLGSTVEGRRRLAAGIRTGGRQPVGIVRQRIGRCRRLRPHQRIDILARLGELLVDGKLGRTDRRLGLAADLLDLLSCSSSLSRMASSNWERKPQHGA